MCMGGGRAQWPALLTSALRSRESPAARRVFLLWHASTMNSPDSTATSSASVTPRLAEDVGTGDLTANLVPADRRSRARVITREDAVLCGGAWFDEVFRRVDARVRSLAVAGRRSRPRRPGAMPTRRPGSRIPDGRTHGTQFPADAVRHSDDHAPATSTPSAARSAGFSTHARHCLACVWRRNTRCGAGAARTTELDCSTRFS